MKISLIVLAGLAASLILRQRSAALRHWLLTMAIVSAGLVPVFEAVVPTWSLPFASPAAFQPYENPLVPSGQPASSAGSAPNTQPRTTAAIEPVVLAASGSGVSRFKAIWIAGVIMSLAVLMAGLFRLTWLSVRARPITSGRWCELMQDLSATYGLRRPVALLESEHPSLLFTWGLVRPKIVLPAISRAWSDDRARVVLTHELAHITRGDWVVQIGAELLRAFYWFNPLLWIVCRKLRLESERACDDEVMNRGVEGTEYATHLVELARALRQPRPAWLPAPAMARPSSLERRVRAMLTNGLNRRPMGKHVRGFIFSGSIGVTAAVAAAQSGFASFSGRITDEQSRGVPGVAVGLANDVRQSKYEVKTNAEGRYEFVGLPAGDYTVLIEGAGFQAIKDVLTVSGQNIQRDYMFKLGTLQETIVIRFNPNEPVDQNAPAPTGKVREVAMPPRKECAASPTGGRIVPPRKIRDVAPIYPLGLRATGTEGTVVMETRIGPDGYPSDITIVGDAHPELAHAAIAAVRDWRYTETLLNCQPVDVMMTVTTKFERMPPPAPRP